jgi:hypothetical protein
MTDSNIVKYDPKKPVRAKRKGESTYDRIWLFYNDQKHNHKLGKKQEEIRQIVEAAWLLWGEEYNRRDTVTRLMATKGIIQKQAYKYVDWACRIFGNPNLQVKTARKELHTQRLERQMKDAEKKEDWERFESLSKQYIKITGMENADDMDLNELAKNFTGHEIVFTADPEALKEQARQMVADVQDIDFEIVPDENKG